MKVYCFLLTILILFSCNQKEEKQRTDVYYLQPTEEYINLPIDEDTYVPRNEISYFEIDGTEYIAFENRLEPHLLIYNLATRSLEKKIIYQKEGANGIGNIIRSFYIKNLNEIYLVNDFAVLKTDGNGNLLKKYDIRTTTSGKETAIVALDMGSIISHGSKFYMTQYLNSALGNEQIEKSSIGITLDTLNDMVEFLPMKHLPLITLEDLHTNAANGYNCRRTFDGEKFIYSFHYSDSVFRVSPDHKQIERYRIKSKYIDEVENPRVDKAGNVDYPKIFEANCEAATYEFIVYDKYREVYYRIAHPKTEVDPKDDHLEVLRSGKKQAIVMILDKDLNVVGETLLPEYTFVPDVYVVREDGLYLSCSHIHNPNYSDDVLSLQKLVLCRN